MAVFFTQFPFNVNQIFLFFKKNRDKFKKSTLFYRWLSVDFLLSTKFKPSLNLKISGRKRKRKYQILWILAAIGQLIRSLFNLSQTQFLKDLILIEVIYKNVNR